MLQNCNGNARTHITPEDCPSVWGEITRLFQIKKNAASAFSGVDVAALKTDIETEATWTTAIALSDPDNIVGSPLIGEVVIPEAAVKVFTSAYGKSYPYALEDIVIELTINAPSNAEEESAILNRFMATQFAFYSDTHKQLIGKKIVANTDQPWFDAYSVVVANRHLTASAGDDKMVLRLYCKGEALEGWEAFDTPFLSDK